MLLLDARDDAPDRLVDERDPDLIELTASSGGGYDGWARERHATGAYPGAVDELLRRFAEDPQRAAVLLDVDGVLAPIVLRPEDSAVPDETRAELERLAGRYSLVACVSGRTSADAERIVGVPELVYVGSHGLELAPEAERWRERLHRFGQSVDWPVEDKGLTVSFHYRGVDDEEAARAKLEHVAARGAGGGPAGALRAQGARAAAADRGRQGHGRPGAARRPRPAPGALRRRRHDRPGRLPRPRRARARGPRRGRSPKAPQNCARPPTWWSTAPLERSSC